MRHRRKEDGKEKFTERMRRMEWVRITFTEDKKEDAEDWHISLAHRIGGMSAFVTPRPTKSLPRAKANKDVLRIGFLFSQQKDN